jgi:predicted membrane metal-binding protein
MASQVQNRLPTDRSFGLTFAAVLALVGVWTVWKGGQHWYLPLAVAALFLLAAFVSPQLLHPLNVAWMRLGHLLNRVVSPIVMGILFFGLLTPLAAVLRLRGRDVLQRRFDRARESYWIKRVPPGPDGSSFPRQY